MSDKVVALVQARMESQRLPGKSMMKICGLPLVWHLLNRLERASLIDEVVLIVPDLPSSEPLVHLAKEMGIAFYAGHPTDLLERHLSAARLHKAGTVVRIPGDNPLPHHLEVDRIISHHLNTNPEGFSTNIMQVFGSGYPDGIGAEVFSAMRLEEKASFHGVVEREHIHRLFFDYATETVVSPERIPVATINCPTGIARPDIVLDVNTELDFLYISKMFEEFWPMNKLFGMNEIITWHDDCGYKIKRGEY